MVWAPSPHKKLLFANKLCDRSFGYSAEQRVANKNKIKIDAKNTAITGREGRPVSCCDARNGFLWAVRFCKGVVFFCSHFVALLPLSS